MGQYAEHAHIAWDSNIWQNPPQAQNGDEGEFYRLCILLLPFQFTKFNLSVAMATKIVAINIIITKKHFTGAEVCPFETSPAYDDALFPPFRMEGSCGASIGMCETFYMTVYSYLFRLFPRKKLSAFILSGFKSVHFR